MDAEWLLAQTLQIAELEEVRRCTGRRGDYHLGDDEGRVVETDKNCPRMN